MKIVDAADIKTVRTKTVSKALKLMDLDKIFGPPLPEGKYYMLFKGEDFIVTQSTVKSRLAEEAKGRGKELTCKFRGGNIVVRTD